MACLFLCLAPGAAGAQQWTTDDTGIVNARSCQLEVWHGQRASWVAPACEPVRGVELSVGAGWAWRDGGGHDRQYALQVKSTLLPLAPGWPGAAVAVGAGLTGEGRLGSVYLYAPVGVSGWNERLTTYGNLGWRYALDGGGHDLTYGARADLSLAPRLTVIGELFGGRGDELPVELQGGIRTTLVPDRLQADVSYGRTLGQPAGRGAGWTVGIALTPPPWLPAPGAAGAVAPH